MKRMVQNYENCAVAIPKLMVDSDLIFYYPLKTSLYFVLGVLCFNFMVCVIHLIHNKQIASVSTINKWIVCN